MASSFNILFLGFIFLLSACGESGGQAPFHFGVRPGTKRIFATGSTYYGNLGGVIGADAKCMSDSNHPGSGTFKAFLSDGNDRIACNVGDCQDGTHVDWVLSPETEYVRLDGTTIATTTPEAIFLFPLERAFMNPQSNHFIYTGMEQDYTSSSFNCFGWTTAAAPGASQAVAGLFGDNTVTGMSAGLVNCDNSSPGERYHLLCVEQ